ncbi:MAG TPA: HEAT repeat domain-containing protein [Gaiellaceae bacterium]
MITLLTWCATGLAAAGWLAVCALAARRLVITRAERRNSEAEVRLRPLALALVEGESVNLEGLDEHEAAVLAALVGRFGRNLRGKSSAHIASFLERRGELQRQLSALETGSAWQRATAAFALGDIGSRRGVHALRCALDDPKAEVRRAAARSLGRLGEPTAVGPVVEALAQSRIPRSVAGQALLAIGEPALPALRALITAPDAEARALAVELVGFLGDASDGGVLVERLRDSSAEVRAKAAHALGRVGAAEGAAELRARLADRIPFVRVAVARALGIVGDPKAVPDLVRVAREDSFDPARAAAHAVARLDPSALRRAAVEPGAGPHLHEAADLLEATA